MKTAIVVLGLSFALVGCGHMPFTTDAGCKIFDDPGFAVQGKRIQDRKWIGKTQETGIAVCDWVRPTK